MPRPVASQPMVFPAVATAFDPLAFQDALSAHGVRMVHSSALCCPQGLVSREDIRRPHGDHEGCSNGFLYEPEGTMTVLFSGNGHEDQPQDVGLLDGSTCQVTLPRDYEDGQEAFVLPYDRFYLAEEAITVATWQRVEASGTGADRLQFPAVAVLKLVDSRGQRYHEGRDFFCQAGQIVWSPGGKRPGADPDGNRGTVYSVRYRYRPFFYVVRLMHEVRVGQVQQGLGPRKVQQLPRAAMLQREYLYQNSEVDPDSKLPNNPRQGPVPADGGFTAR